MRIFITIEPNPIIERKLNQALHAHFTGARVVTCETMQDAVFLIGNKHANACLFISSVTVTPIVLAILADAVQYGLRVIFVGDKPDFRFAAGSLSVPFTDVMVADAVRSTWNVAPLRQAANNN